MIIRRATTILFALLVGVVEARAVEFSAAIEGAPIPEPPFISSDVIPLVRGGVTYKIPITSVTSLGMASDASNAVLPNTRTNLGLDKTSNAFLTGGGAGAAYNAVSITGLVLGNGASAPSAYAGAACTNQFPRSLSAAGAAICATVGSADLAASLSLVSPLLGTPTSGVATNLTGTAAGLTAGNVTTNANLTGNVTSVGNATTIAAGVVTNAMLAGSIAASKLVGTDITTLGTIGTGIWQGTAIAVANGGTGTTTAADARTNLGLGTGSSPQFSALTITGAASVGSVSIGAGAWTLGNQTPVAGGDMQIANLLEVNTVPVTTRGALWSGKTYAFGAWSKEFTSTSPFTFTGAASPQFVGLFNATNTSSGYDVVALGATATAMASNGRVHAANFVSLTGGGGLTGINMNVIEADFEPAVGDTVTGGGAISAVVFSGQHAVPGFYTALGSVGAAFQYDFLSLAAYGSAFRVADSSPAVAFDAASATLSNAALLLGVDTPSTNQQRVRWGWGGTNIFDAYSDGTSMNLALGGSTGFIKVGSTNGTIFRSATDQNIYLRGKQNLSTGATLSSLNDANNAFQGMEYQASSHLLSGPVTFSGAVNQFGLVAGTPAHVSTGQATAPALTSCGTGSPSIVGTDTAGVVTLGTAATGCVITFDVAYAAVPHCTVTWQATPLLSQSYTVSNAAMTLTQTSASSNLISYVCIGRSGG